MECGYRVFKHVPRNKSRLSRLDYEIVDGEQMSQEEINEEINGVSKFKVNSTKTYTGEEYAQRLTTIKIVGSKVRVVYTDRFWEELPQLIYSSTLEMIDKEDGSSVDERIDPNSKYFPLRVKYFAKDNRLSDREWKEDQGEQTTYIYLESKKITNGDMYKDSIFAFVDKFHSTVKNCVDGNHVDRRNHVLDFEITVFVYEDLFPDGEIVLLS